MQSVKLEQVREQVIHDDKSKWDTLVERDQVRFHDGRLRLPRSAREDGGSARSLRLTPWATGQLCTKLGIPASYWRRCPASLQDAQINHWLHEGEAGEGDSRDDTAPDKPERWLLRAKGDLVRGVLSERYARVNNHDVLESLLPTLVEARYQVNWFALTDESLHLRVFDPKLSREVLPGDRVMAGLHIGNSEVGKRAITVDALVYRLVCQNGLVRLVKGKSILHHRHIGHVGASKAELGVNLGNAIRDALVQSSGFMERLEQATREPVTDMEGVIATIASDGNLSLATAEKVTKALTMERVTQRDTLFGLVNALTNTAQSLLPDDRYALETLAGRLLESGPPKVIKAVNGSREVTLPRQSSSPPPALVPLVPVSVPPLSAYSNGANLSLFGS